jgi:hypothetical protein
MPPPLCVLCKTRNAALKRPKTLQMICRECFFEVFEEEIHQTIVTNKLFQPGERVAIAASGGKGLRKRPILIFEISMIDLYFRFDRTCRDHDRIEQTIQLPT